MPEITVTSGKTIWIEEKQQSRSGSEAETGVGTEEQRYVASGSPDETDVKEAVRAVAPSTTSSGYEFNQIRYNTDYENGDDTIWQVRVEYTSPVGAFFQGTRDIEVGEAKLRITAGTEDIVTVMPVSVVDRIRPGGVNPVIYEGIGDNGKTFDGANVPTPVFSFAYDFNIPGSSMTTSLMWNMSEVVGKINQGGFKGFPEGEVLCSAINGTFTTGENSLLSFEFKRKPESPAATLGGPLPAEWLRKPATKGWDYLDFHTRTTINDNPRQIHVEITQLDIYQVFEYYDFNKLGIPGEDIVIPE